MILQLPQQPSLQWLGGRQAVDCEETLHRQHCSSRRSKLLETLKSKSPSLLWPTSVVVLSGAPMCWAPTWMLYFKNVWQSDQVVKILLSTHCIFSGKGVKTTEEHGVCGMSRHLDIFEVQPWVERQRRGTRSNIFDTDLILCLVTCVILCPRARALEAGVSTPEVLNPALGANPVKRFIFWV